MNWQGILFDDSLVRGIIDFFVSGLATRLQGRHACQLINLSIEREGQSHIICSFGHVGDFSL
jgi:hypothetical protein